MVLARMIAGFGATRVTCVRTCPARIRRDLHAGQFARDIGKVILNIAKYMGKESIARARAHK